MHLILVNRLGGLSLPRNSLVRLTERPDVTIDVYHGCKQQYNIIHLNQTGKINRLIRILAACKSDRYISWQADKQI